MTQAKFVLARCRVLASNRGLHSLGTARLTQADLDKLELVDLDQVDADEKGAIAPAATGLAAEMRRNWQASVEEEVAVRLVDREAELRATMQVRALCACKAMQRRVTTLRLPVQPASALQSTITATIDARSFKLSALQELSSAAAVPKPARYTASHPPSCSRPNRQYCMHWCRRSNIPRASCTVEPHLHAHANSR